MDSVLGSNLFFSCYLTPMKRICAFQNKVDCLEDEILPTEGATGDSCSWGILNARAVERGIPHPDSWSKYIMEMVPRTDPLVLNVSQKKKTFWCPRFMETILYISLASRGLAP